MKTGNSSRSNNLFALASKRGTRSLLSAQVQSVNSFLFDHNISLTRILALCFLILITVISFYIMCSSAETECTRAPVEEAPPADLLALSLGELQAMQSCNSIWMQSYNNADEKRKKEFELLFRCHIVPKAE